MVTGIDRVVIEELSALDGSRQAMVAIKLPETTIVAINAAGEALFGVAGGRLLDRHASCLFHGTDEVHASVALSALASGAIDSYCARRRMVNRPSAEVWTVVRAFMIAGTRIAVGLAVPGDAARPLDGVEAEVRALRGDVWPSPGDFADSDVGASPASIAPVFEALDSLPVRQREIVAALLQGKRTAGIAREMFVSESTVRSHLSAIFKAFGVKSQTQLITLLRSRAAESLGEATSRHR
jgi:DNA-binding CsgD family transcriptional regulator